MVYPPGQGKSGEYLMQIWRQYLEKYAAQEGNIEEQIVTGSYYAAEIFGFFSLALDKDKRFSGLIEDRIRYFQEGNGKAEVFGDHLINAAFAIYNHLSTLATQFSRDNQESLELVREVNRRVQEHVESAGQLDSTSAAIRAAFPLLSLMTLILDQSGSITPAIRKVEQRFTAGAARAGSAWEQLLNGLYRLVEMMQLFVVLSDSDLRGQVEQIATRFEEEDQVDDLRAKMRNGFCRLFELGHLLATHLDEML
jgi:hypothetical protein